MTATLHARPPHAALVSAHRCGRGDTPHGDNRSAGVRESILSGVDFVEFDVQRCLDGVFVCYHNDEVVGPDGALHRIDTLTHAELKGLAPEIEPLADILFELAASAVSAHVDLKFTSPAPSYASFETTYEAECAAVIAAALDPSRIIFTTMEDVSVRALRQWVSARGHDMLVGLSLGRNVSGMGRLRAWWTQLSEVYPSLRMRRCDATLLVVNHRLAERRLLAWADRRKMPVLVWTVDEPELTSRLLSDSRVWLLTTNLPSQALRLRAEGLGEL